MPGLLKFETFLALGRKESIECEITLSDSANPDPIATEEAAMQSQCRQEGFKA